MKLTDVLMKFIQILSVGALVLLNNELRKKYQNV